jgi:AraC-like DNA-binding protein
MIVKAPRISVQLISHIVDWVRARGLTESGIHAPSLADPERMIPLGHYVRLFELAAAVSGVPDLGLRLGATEDVAALGALGYLFMSAPSMLDACEGFAAHLDALQQQTTNQLMIVDDTITIQYRINDNRVGQRRQDSEYSISAMHNLVHLYSGGRIRPKVVYFEHRLVGRYATYRDRFRCEVIFEQPVNTLVYNRQGFNMRSTAGSAVLNPIIASHLSGLMRRRASMHSFASLVGELIEQRTGTTCTQPEVASELGVSVATLGRRLKSEGTSFRVLLADRRLAAAARMLLLDERPIADIALAAGYAENASFTRAFRRHNGLSPEQYRRKHRQRANRGAEAPRVRRWR